MLVALLVAANALFAEAGEDILRLEREIVVATWTGDSVWFEENLADEYVVVTPDGEARSKKDVIRGLVRPGLKMEPYEATELQIRVYTDAAVATGRMQQSFSLGRTRYKNDLRFTHVYAKRKGKWLLVAAHTSAVK